MLFSDQTHDRRWRFVSAILFFLFIHVESNKPVFEKGVGIQHVDFHVGCDLRLTPLLHSFSSWRENITFSIFLDSAQFLVFHFTYLRLPRNATLSIWDPNEYEKKIQGHTSFKARQQYGYTTPPSPFYTHPLYSKRAILEYVVYTQPPDGQCYGFQIDEVRFAAQSIYRGFIPNHVGSTRRQLYEVNMNAEDDEYDANGKNVATGDQLIDDTGANAIGGDLNTDTCVTSSDSSEEVACIRYNAGIFESSRPVVRLLVHKEMGSIFCTGWVLGCQGHIITNHHCVSNREEANATVIEFLAQGPKCRERCDVPLGCPGIVEATSSMIIASSPMYDLDYTLLLPRLSPAQRFLMIQTYGYLSFRSSGLMPNERIFIPQHPSGFGKRVAIKDQNEFGQGNIVHNVGCNNLQNSVGYLLDTRGGSSGAPVIAYNDKAVVGLHYCGGCMNYGIPSQDIVRHLILINKLPKCAQTENSSQPSTIKDIDENDYQATLEEQD